MKLLSMSLLVALCVCQLAIAQVPIEKVAAEIPALFEQTQSPGAVFAIFRGPNLEVVNLQLLGFADEKHTRPISRDDHFRIASVTKTFVGTVILKLADEGKLSLDDPISKYVEGVPNGEQITLKMLGNHTSGVAREMTNKELQKAVSTNPTKQWTADEVLAYTWKLQPLFPPGKGWMYSNSNTILLGKVIEKVTGKPWYEAVDEMVCKPLGLKQTGYPKESKVPEPFPRGYRFGKKENLISYGDFWFDATDWSASVWNAAGDLYSTLDDVAKFTRAAARGELVGEQSRKVLFDWYRTGFERVDYGFHIARKDGAIGNSGDIPGYSATAMYLPDRDLTIVCLMNLTATVQKETASSVLVEYAVQALGSNATTQPAKSQ